MARRGFLDYVLGGAVGGLEGLAQQRAAEDEKKRMADAASRQAMLDALAMEDRAQAKEDRLRSQRERLLGSGYVREGMDMPGATPRKAVNTEMVGGDRYSVYSTPRQLAMQAAMEEAELKKKFNPKDQLTAAERQVSADKAADRASRERIAAGRASKDGSDKAKSAGIDKAIAGAGKIVTSSRNEEKMAETQIAALDRNRPDPYKLELGGQTDEQIAAAEAAWQKKMDAAEKRLEAAQGKTSRLSPTYEGSLVSRDTTGYGEAFGPPAAPAKQPTRTPFNTQEDALAKQASAMIQQWMRSGAPKEEISAAVSKINNRLANEIRALRSGGK
jgi:hypothetical protein